MVRRAEVDMVQIKQEFQKMYGQSLEQFVKVSTDCMLYLILEEQLCIQIKSGDWSTDCILSFILKKLNNTYIEILLTISGSIY
jgi:hypothetical protein